MKEIRKIKEQRTISLTPEMKVSEIIDLWPQTLDTFIKMGFAPLKNKFLRQTIARNITLRQAANFRNVDLNILQLNLQTTILNPTAHNQSFIDPDRLRFDENTIPELTGDLRIMGLIPCPVRNILVENFDSFIQKNLSSKGVKTAWWLAAEGSGSKDIKNFLVSVIKSEQYDNFPEIFISVGSELFLNEDYCRILYERSFFKKIKLNKNKRPEFKKLEDPGDKLQLQFAVLFSFNCLKEPLKGLPLPKTWHDLTNPEYKGLIVIPSLDLPVMPDFLASLYYYYGDSLFIKFCQNVLFASHPAQSSPRKVKKKKPCIFITPLHFSRISKSEDNVHIIPEDGLVAVPAYFVNTKG
jgi:hypothetical protein